MVDGLILSLASHKPLQTIVDRLIWTPNEAKGYSVKSFLEMSTNKLCSRSISSYIIEFVWQKRSPLRAQFFKLFLVHERIMCGSYLQNLGLISLDQAVCSFSSNEIETLSHLFFSCSMSWQVWSRCCK